jgi:hypothetical protein
VGSLDKAIRTLTTAAKSTVDDPDSAYVLAYDAARYACTALLVQQRPQADNAWWSLRSLKGLYVRSSATASAPSAPCEDVATSSGTPPSRATRRLDMKPSRRSRVHNS